MKKVTVEIPDDCDLVFENGNVRLVKSIDIEKSDVLNEIRSDIDILYEKYKDRLKGKFGIKCEFSFISYRSGNRKCINHWVENTNCIEVIEKELSWHD